MKSNRGEMFEGGIAGSNGSEILQTREGINSIGGNLVFDDVPLILVNVSLKF